jgi:hypothetical protein
VCFYAYEKLEDRNAACRMPVLLSAHTKSMRLYCHLSSSMVVGGAACIIGLVAFLHMPLIPLLLLAADPAAPRCCFCGRVAAPKRGVCRTSQAACCIRHGWAWSKTRRPSTNCSRHGWAQPETGRPRTTCSSRDQCWPGKYRTCQATAAW